MNRRDTILAVVALAGATWSRVSFAQQAGKVWRVGFLSPTSASLSSSNANAFLKGMRALGYFEDKNLLIEWRFADGKLDRLLGLAAELVQLKVDVIVAGGSAAISAAQKAATTTPIVMAIAGDPVGGEFVKNLARPGGNTTGLSSLGGDIGPKQFDLMNSVVPKLSRVAVLTPNRTYSPRLQSVQAAAKKVGVKILVAEALTLQAIENAFSEMAREKADAVIVGSPATFAQQHVRIAELALKHRIPSMFADRVAVEVGGLMSYGQRITDYYLRSASYVDKILKGAKPGELPVEQPVSFELVINLKTAKALGLTIPPKILLRADEVIE